jgi:hypothetical protein
MVGAEFHCKARKVKDQEGKRDAKKKGERERDTRKRREGFVHLV